MRILIIEDEHKVANFLKRGFQAEGYAVDVAPDGERGVHLACGEPYDAIILDVMLPRKNGIEVLKEIRGSRLMTPILMLSAKSDLEDRLEGLNRGADDYLPKPFNFSEVLARIRAITRRSASDLQGSVLTMADLHVDLLTRTVRRGGAAIELTNKEFQVLEYLLRNKGRVLSRVLLTEHVWDMNFDSETNIVDVVINRLRRKIDDKFSVKLIRTVRGVGYKMEETPDEDPEAT